MEKEKENRRQFKKYFKIISFLVILLSILYYLFKDTKFIETIINGLNRIHVELSIISMLFLFIYTIEKYLFYKYINFFTKKYVLISICLANSLCIILPLYLYLNEKMNTYLFLVFKITFSISFILYCFVLIAEKINQNNPIETSEKVKTENNNEKLFTLNEILNMNNSNNEKLKNIDKIVIKDSDDDIPDVFKMERTKEDLKNEISYHNDKTDCFTIGIVGEWGIGKSTIINSTIKELDENTFILIRDFDPWTIKSQDALILAMYNTIMENLGENIGYFKRKKVQNALINTTTNIPYIGKGIGNYFENNIDDYTKYKEIKADLEEKLKKFDKRLIFIIDNLDRMKSDNVIFLLTLIETLFKLPNITYIVAYDRNRLNTIFKDEKINSKYFEKIISKEIFMPTLNRDILEKCLKNLLNAYKYYYNKNDYAIKCICKRFTNIRQFIGFCNSLTKIPKDFEELEKNLQMKIDLEYNYVIIQFIKYFDYNSYLELYNDRELFIDNEERNRLIDNKYKEYTNLLNLLFPNQGDKTYSILNPVLFRLCFLDKDDSIDKIKNFITNYTIFPNSTILSDYLDILYFNSKYDIIYGFSPFPLVLNFKDLKFEHKEAMWNFFTESKYIKENNIFNKIASPYRTLELETELDNNIKYILKYIFDIFQRSKNKEDLQKLIDNQKSDFRKNNVEYCKKLIVYEWLFIDMNCKKSNDFMDKLYEPILKDPIIIKDEEIFSKFYSYLTTRYSLRLPKTLYYIDKLFCNAVTKGVNLYEFISFFILKKDIFNYLESLEIMKIIVIPGDIHHSIKKYPPKDATEEKIKRDFEEKYPNK